MHERLKFFGCTTGPLTLRFNCFVFKLSMKLYVTTVIDTPGNMAVK